MDELRARDEVDLYDRDFELWAEVQAGHLRCGRHDLLDTAYLIEEIEALGKAQLFTLRSSHTLIALHLLKQLMQPGNATASWENTVNRERGNVAELLAEYPGPKPKRAEAFGKAYGRARRDAAFETRLDARTFPTEPPFTLEQAKARDWWPLSFPPQPGCDRLRPARRGSA